MIDPSQSAHIPHYSVSQGPNYAPLAPNKERQLQLELSSLEAILELLQETKNGNVSPSIMMQFKDLQNAFEQQAHNPNPDAIAKEINSFINQLNNNVLPAGTCMRFAFEPTLQQAMQQNMHMLSLFIFSATPPLASTQSQTLLSLVNTMMTDVSNGESIPPSEYNGLIDTVNFAINAALQQEGKPSSSHFPLFPDKK